MDHNQNQSQVKNTKNIAWHLQPNKLDRIFKFSSWRMKLVQCACWPIRGRVGNKNLKMYEAIKNYLKLE